jgi:predicted permease
MPVLRVFLAKCRALFRRNVVAEEIRDEMQFHVDMRTEALRKRGLSADEATRAAQRRFGNRTLMQDRGYDVRGASVLDSVIQDVRFSVRLLVQQPGFSLVAIVTVALAIGASSAVFSVVDAAIIRPLSYPDADRLVHVNVRQRIGDEQLDGLSPSFNELEQWRATNRVLTSLSQAREGDVQVVVDAGQPERLRLGQASADYFETFGIAPVIGRVFTVDEMRGQTATIALISHAFWQRQFGGDRSALGRSIRVDREMLTIVGVVPPGFYTETSVWRPLLVPTPVMAVRRGSGTPTYGRLRPGVDYESASREMTDLARQIATAAGESTDFEVRLSSLYEDTVSRYRSTMWILTGTVVVIVLIACINVSGLLLARGTTRQAELAIRASIGAGRGRLVRQLLTENLVLALAGGLCGLGIAWLLLDVLVANLPVDLPANSAPAMDAQAFFFAGGLAVFSALLFGLLPALRLSQRQITSGLASASGRVGPALSRRGGQLLIGAEVALAIVLLAGAGLLVRSFARSLSIDIGFEPRTFVTMEVFPVDPSLTARREYYTQLVDSIRRIPGVSAAGTGLIVPLGNGGSYTNATAGALSINASIKDMSPGYIEALGLAPIQGRLPTAADGQAAAVLSESGARRLFPAGNAIGNHFEANRRTFTVVGIVRDIRSRYLFRTDSRPDLYLPFDPKVAFQSRRMPIVFVRPTGRIAGLADDLRRAAHNVGSPVIVERIRFGSDWFSDHVADPRQRTLLIGSLGALGLLLTLVGIFGVTAYAVARRTQEIGVRMAFGARPAQVVGRVIADAAWPMATGIGAGLLGAYYATRVIESFLFETTPHDPVTFAAVAVFMAATALVAAWLPARRAARVDPVAALRAE